jgi:hypothetical protein
MNHLALILFHFMNYLCSCENPRNRRTSVQDPVRVRLINSLFFMTFLPMTTEYSCEDVLRFTFFLTSKSRLRLFTGGSSAAARSQETLEFDFAGAPPIPTILANSQVAPGPGLTFREKPGVRLGRRRHRRSLLCWGSFSIRPRKKSIPRCYQLCVVNCDH